MSITLVPVGPVNNRSSSALKEMIGVIAMQELLGLQTECFGARQRAAVRQRSGGICRAVSTVRAAREHNRMRQARKVQRGGKGKFLIPPAFAITSHGHRRLSA